MTKPNEKIAAEIGKKIRGLRSALGLTQAVLAEAADLESGYLSQVERGHKLPSLGALFRIADALKTTPAALIEGGKASKDDALVREVREVLARWKPKQRKALLQALRILADS